MFSIFIHVMKAVRDINSDPRLPVFGFLSSKSSDPKNVPFQKFQPEKRLPKIVGDLFRVKIS